MSWASDQEVMLTSGVNLEFHLRSSPGPHPKGAVMTSQILCITKPDRYNDHEAITDVGGVRASGAGFYIARQRCANDIHSKREAYFVKVGANRVDVQAYVKNGAWLIKTEPDHTRKDNLLRLPKCP